MNKLKLTVIVTNQEEWDRVKKALYPNISITFESALKSYPEGVCLGVDGYANTKWFQDNGYNVLTFSEWLRSIGEEVIINNYQIY